MDKMWILLLVVFTLLICTTTSLYQLYGMKDKRMHVLVSLFVSGLGLTHLMILLLL